MEVAHLFAIRGVVAGFDAIGEDNRQIITIIEGVAIVSMAAFVATVIAAVA